MIPPPKFDVGRAVRELHLLIPAANVIPDSHSVVRALIRVVGDEFERSMHEWLRELSKLRIQDPGLLERAAVILIEEFERRTKNPPQTVGVSPDPGQIALC